MQLRLFIEDSRFLVANERIVLPAIPQLLDNIDEFIGPLIALFIAQMFIAAKIPRLLLGPGRNNVPSGPAATDMVEGRIFSGNMKRLVIRSRSSRHQSDIRGVSADGREQCERFELRVLRIAG